MRLVGGGQCEVGGQVTFQHLGCSDHLEQSPIHLLLIGFAFVRHDRRFGCIPGKEFRLTICLGRILGSGKVLIGDRTNVNGTDIDFGARGNHVGRVDAAEWDTIDFERTRYQEKTRFQCFETDHALAAETSGQDNDNGARSDGFSDSRRILFNYVYFFGRLDIFCRIIARCFLCFLRKSLMMKLITMSVVWLHKLSTFQKKTAIGTQI